MIMTTTVTVIFKLFSSVVNEHAYKISSSNHVTIAIKSLEKQILILSIKQKWYHSLISFFSSLSLFCSLFTVGCCKLSSYLYSHTVENLYISSIKTSTWYCKFLFVFFRFSSALLRVNLWQQY